MPFLALPPRVRRTATAVLRGLFTAPLCLSFVLFNPNGCAAQASKSVKAASSSVQYPTAYSGTDVLQAGAPPFTSTTPANTVSTNEPPYNTRIARLTDMLTLRNGSAFTVPGGGSSNGVVTNSPGTLVALESLGGEAYVFGYNPSTMQIWPSSNPVVACSGASGFSRGNPVRWYCMPKGETKVYAVDFAKLPNGPCGMAMCYDPSHAIWTVVKDFAACPQASSAAPTWVSFLGVGVKDADLAVSISWTGLQGTAHLFFDYLPATHECITYDTEGNGVSPEWYSIDGEPNVVANYVTGLPLEASWTIHDSWSNGTWAQVSITKCSGSDCGSEGPPTIYLPAHAAYVMGKYPGSSGHNTMSATRFYNNTNPQIEERSLSTPAQGAPMSTFSSCEDSHFSGDVRSDSNALLGTRGGLATTTWTTPFMNEVFGVSQAGSVYRFSPTWSSGRATNFYGRYAIAGFSQDRKTAFFTSDMGCQLRTGCGTDVFAVDLTGN